MWSTDTPWFDLAVWLAIYSAGTILFGRFEEHKPRWRRLAKLGIVVAGLVALLANDLRGVAYAVLAFFGLAAAVVHGWWLPRHGIHGWTGEPRDKYYDLLKVPLDQRPGGRPGTR